MSCHYKPYTSYKLSYVTGVNKARGSMSGGGFGGKGKSILLVIDVQNDFLPGGSLGVLHGMEDQNKQCDEAIAQINKLIDSDKFDLICYTQDAHPPGHTSFASSHEGKAPFQTTTLTNSTNGNKYEQVLWPDHCRTDCEHIGMNYSDKLHRNTKDSSKIFEWSKGCYTSVDSYSAFKDAEGKDTGLHLKLINMGVTDICVSGIARDFCVWWTARDATTYVDESGKQYFNVVFAWDATLPVPGGKNNPDYESSDATPHQKRIKALSESGTDFTVIYADLLNNNSVGNKWVEACLTPYGIKTLNTDNVLKAVDAPDMHIFPPPPSEPFTRQSGVTDEVYSPTPMTEAEPPQVTQPAQLGGYANRKPVFKLTAANTLQNTLDLRLFRR